jgi:beta-galactosidase/beta-glucuronidase
MTVPGYLHGTVSRRAWLRRSFDLPRPTQPERLTLRFGGVKFNSRVLVNGRQVGGCFGGYDPFEVDITQAIRPGQANELMVGLHDWTGIFTPGKVNFKESDDWLTVRSAPLDRILAPIGGLFALYGIWDDVTLITHPEVSIKDLFIKPSVRRVELTVDCTLANQSATDVDVNLQAAVEDRGREVLRLPVAKVKVPAGKTARATLNQAWKTPHLWSHVDPYLYQLRVRLSTGDCLRTRFGFREFWTHGSDFYLNGVKTALLATSWWPPHSPAPRAQIAEHWQAIKKAGCVAFRTHTQPWPETPADWTHQTVVC